MRVLPAMMALPFAALSFSALSFLATPAAAQDWNNLATSEAINQVHAAMREHMMVTPSADDAPGGQQRSGDRTAIDAEYTVDPAVRRSVQQQLVASVAGQHAAAGQELAVAFAQHDLIAIADRALASMGLQSGNVIDAVTIYRLGMWGAAKGLVTPPPRAAIDGARQQTAAIFDLAGAGLNTPAQRQRFSETLLYQAILMDLASEQAHQAGDQATIGAIRDSARQALRASGIDADSMQLSAQGFVRNR